MRPLLEVLRYIAFNCSLCIKCQTNACTKMSQAGKFSFFVMFELILKMKFGLQVLTSYCIECNWLVVRLLAQWPATPVL